MKNNWLRGYTLVYLIFLYAPILLLPLFAFNASTIIAFPLQGFTTDWFKELLTIDALHGAVRNSLFIAVVSAVFATSLGVCASMAGARYEFKAKRGLMGLIMLPLVLPEIIVAVALLVVLVQLGVGLSSWTVIMGHSLICTPFCIAILNASFQNLDPSFEEAALDLGETRFSTFYRITLPLIFPGIISALLISFIISLDEFIIAFFLTGNEPTLPVYLWGQLRFPQKIPVVMALGTLLVALSVVLLTLAELLRRHGQRKLGQQDTGGFL